MQWRYIKAHDIMSRNILTLQQDQEMRELIGPYQFHWRLLDVVTPNMWFGQQVQVPWSWRLRRRTGVGSLEVNNQLFALIWVHLGIFVSRLLLYCCMLQRFGLLKACICSHTMAITGPNDHIGSAGLTNRNRWSCGKIFGGQRFDETCRRINKFYNYCLQKTIH